MGKYGYEVPSAIEKQSGKFILDSLKDRNFKDTKAIPVDLSENSSIAPQEEVCGTSADAPVPTEAAQTAFPPEAVTPEAETFAYEPLALSDKKYFRIGEVADLLKVEPYVLRYWETEFPSVKPIKSKSGQRVYARKDVETLNFIRHLLYIEKFSIKGAKKKLQERRKEVSVRTGEPQKEKREQFLKSLATDLKDLLQTVKQDSIGTF